MEWRDIETAPKDDLILLYGERQPMELLPGKVTLHFVGYWDEIDNAWCSVATTFHGPFYRPTHWMPLPEPPQ